MDMTGETTVMSVLKMWLHSVHKGKKRITKFGHQRLESNRWLQYHLHKT